MQSPLLLLPATTQPANLPPRIASKINVIPSGCWQWTGAITGHGYGNVRWDGRAMPAHIIVYTLTNGPVPDGLELDHTCHNTDTTCPGARNCLHRRCVNPDHLEAVTHRTNILRGHTLPARNARRTTCIRGHNFDVISDTGHRSCTTCMDLFYERRRAAKAHLKAAA